FRRRRAWSGRAVERCRRVDLSTGLVIAIIELGLATRGGLVHRGEKAGGHAENPQQNDAGDADGQRPGFHGSTLFLAVRMLLSLAEELSRGRGLDHIEKECGPPFGYYGLVVEIVELQW